MTALKFLIAGVLVGIAIAVAPAQSEKLLTILDTFQGTVGNEDKPQLKTAFIATKADWKVVWAIVNPNEELPDVDFKEQFLLVSTRDAADPNERTTIILKDDKGIVRLSGMTTAMAFKPSDQTIYSFYKVARGGVTSVQSHRQLRGKNVIDPLPKRSDLRMQLELQAKPELTEASARQALIAILEGKDAPTFDTRQRELEALRGGDNLLIMEKNADGILQGRWNCDLKRKKFSFITRIGGCMYNCSGEFEFGKSKWHAKVGDEMWSMLPR